jgi:hypothetical protein
MCGLQWLQHLLGRHTGEHSELRSRVMHYKNRRHQQAWNEEQVQMMSPYSLQVKSQGPCASNS